MLRVLVLCLCLALSGCSLRLPGIARTQDRALLVRPYLFQPSTVQTIVPTKTRDDIQVVAILPLRDPGDGIFRPISRQTGELLEPSERLDEVVVRPDVLRAMQWAHMTEFDHPVTLGGLRANGRYRLTALALDRQGRLISKVEASSVELTLSEDDAPVVETPLPLHLVDTPFGASAIIHLAITGNASRLDSFMVRLFRLEEGPEPIPVTAFPVPAGTLPVPLQLTHLKAGTRYLVQFEPQVNEGQAPAPVQVVLNVENDDSLPEHAIVVDLP